MESIAEKTYYPWVRVLSVGAFSAACLVWSGWLLGSLLPETAVLLTGYRVEASLQAHEATSEGILLRLVYADGHGTTRSGQVQVAPNKFAVEDWPRLCWLSDLFPEKPYPIGLREPNFWLNAIGWLLLLIPSYGLYRVALYLLEKVSFEQMLPGE